MMRGEGMGAKARRWWWGVNSWELPEGAEKRVGQMGPGGGRAGDHKLAGEVGDVSSFSRLKYFLSGRLEG